MNKFVLAIGLMLAASPALAGGGYNQPAPQPQGGDELTVNDSFNTTKTVVDTDVDVDVDVKKHETTNNDSFNTKTSTKTNTNTNTNTNTSTKTTTTAIDNSKEISKAELNQNASGIEVYVGGEGGKDSHGHDDKGGQGSGFATGGVSGVSNTASGGLINTHVNTGIASNVGSVTQVSVGQK